MKFDSIDDECDLEQLKTIEVIVILDNEKPSKRTPSLKY